jgi:pentatricopeptide repeat protein
MTPDTLTFNAAIMACARSGRWREAEGVVATMLQRGVTPSLATYNSLISACGKGGRWGRALEFFKVRQPFSAQGMIRLSGWVLKSSLSCWGVAQAMADGPVKPDVVTCNSVMHACNVSREWARALEVFDAMAVEPDRFTFATAIKACSGLGDTDRWVMEGTKPGVEGCGLGVQPGANVWCGVCVLRGQSPAAFGADEESGHRARHGGAQRDAQRLRQGGEMGEGGDAPGGDEGQGSGRQVRRPGVAVTGGRCGE